jgi:hypothetical protein
MTKVRTEFEASAEVAHTAYLNARGTILVHSCWGLVCIFVGTISPTVAYFSVPLSSLGARVVLVVIGIGILAIGGVSTYMTVSLYRAKVKRYIAQHGTPIYIIPAGAIEVVDNQMIVHKTEVRRYEKPIVVDGPLIPSSC